MTTFVQAPRLDTDGAINVSVVDNDRKIAVSVVDDGTEHTLVMSRFNASRVFAGLALLLGIPLPKATGKAIKL